MPGDKKFKTKELSAQINSARLSFAEAEDMIKYLDIEPGSASVMGLMNDRDKNVQLLIDEDVLKEEYFADVTDMQESLGIRICTIITSFANAARRGVWRQKYPAGLSAAKWWSA